MLARVAYGLAFIMRVLDIMSISARVIMTCFACFACIVEHVGERIQRVLYVFGLCKSVLSVRHASVWRDL